MASAEAPSMVHVTSSSSIRWPFEEHLEPPTLLRFVSHTSLRRLVEHYFKPSRPSLELDCNESSSNLEYTSLNTRTSRRLSASSSHNPSWTPLTIMSESANSSPQTQDVDSVIKEYFNHPCNQIPPGEYPPYPEPRIPRPTTNQVPGPTTTGLPRSHAFHIPPAGTITEADNAILRQQLSALTIENTQLRTRLRSHYHTKELHHLKRALSHAEATTVNTHHQLQRTKADNHRLRHDLKHLRRAGHSHRSANDIQEIATLDTQLASQTHLLHKTRAELKLTSSKLHATTATLTARTSELDTTIKALDAQRAATSAATTKLRAAENAAHNQKVQLERTKTFLRGAQADIVRYVGAVMREAEKRTEVQARLGVREREVGYLRERVVGLRGEVRKMREEGRGWWGREEVHVWGSRAGGGIGDGRNGRGAGDVEWEQEEGVEKDSRSDDDDDAAKCGTGQEEKEGKDDNCPICLEPYTITTTTTTPHSHSQLKTTSPCGHTFHTPCLKEWTKQGMNCPYCRQQMVWVLAKREQASSISPDSAPTSSPNHPDDNMDEVDEVLAAADVTDTDDNNEEEEEDQGSLPHAQIILRAFGRQQHRGRPLAVFDHEVRLHRRTRTAATAVRAGGGGGVPADYGVPAAHVRWRNPAVVNADDGAPDGGGRRGSWMAGSRPKREGVSGKVKSWLRKKLARPA